MIGRMIDAHPLIELVPGPDDAPRARLVATRYPVWQVLDCAAQRGIAGCAEEMGLAVAQVRAAVEYARSAPLQVHADRTRAARTAVLFADT